MKGQYYYLQCVSCHKKTSEKETVSTCLSCGGPLDVIYDYDFLKKRINRYNVFNSPPNSMKYLDFFPLNSWEDLVSLQEGSTPLLHAKRLGKKMGLKNLFFKNEGLNPTGAFKDRGSFIEINKAKELGFKSIVVASTGNMAASVSAYATQAGLDCYVFVPENTPKGKLAQSLSYGAKVIQIRGTYNDAASLAEQAAKKYNFYLAGDYVFRLEGQKTCGYELAEQLMWDKSIDWVIVPIGMGTNLSAIFKGLREYKELGLIDYLPKIVGVQADGAHSLFRKGRSYTVKPVAKPQTVASAIAVGNPLDAPKVIRALSRTDGCIKTATDEQTLEAQQLLTHLEALYVEPSAATTVVALQHLIKDQQVKSTDTVVCIATGAGLKDPAATLKVLAEPPTVEPYIKEIERAISGKLFAIRAGGVKDKEKILMSQVPSAQILSELVKREFSLDLSKKDLHEVFDDVRFFINRKGKQIAKADLQSILEDAIQEKHPKILELLDFEITTTQNKRPVAKVEVRLKNRSYKAESEGVGPVDAGIQAIRKILRKYNGIDFNIDDFAVEIPTTGADATVKVTMILKDKKGNKVVEKGTSPDIIVASMNAYVAGYNELSYKMKGALQV